jgi:hypothetical protein
MEKRKNKIQIVADIIKNVVSKFAILFGFTITFI